MLGPKQQKWVDALRSGKYKQARSWLCARGKYCCLGVACDLVNKDIGLNVDNVGTFVRFDQCSTALPDKVKEYFSLNFCDGRYNLTESLGEQNDTGKTFEEIADIIEAEASSIFKEVV